MNFYKHYIGDFQRDTAHLSLLERGAYRELLDALYANERPLPKDRKDLYRIARCESGADRKAVDRVIAEFFTETPEGYMQRRAMDEISKAAHQRAVNQSLGKLGGRPRKTQSVLEAGQNDGPKMNRTETESVSESVSESVNEREPNGNRTETEPEPNRNPNQTPEYSVSKDTGVPPAPRDPPDPIFGDGLAYLREAGIPERGARSLLGKLRKTVGDLVAVELLAKAQQLSVSDPASWLRAAAERRMAAGRTGNGVAL